ncbi:MULTISPECIES: YHS domain-containing protein [unclassified Leucobacter]|uniref:YHS domain-containing protein n=1 Tax=unclassified Leucobacter TaxID=2621730 RepID=UPI00165DEA45|nr:MULTISPECIES: YHS domain-containing protein [unclassified Leucobacter]MBC9927024.1 YHS domain-containing protein [Leucobacter sp. cx-169]MBC9936303.1 YHS domain-containing protein [Leucobacter sp. cx-87]
MCEAHNHASTTEAEVSDTAECPVMRGNFVNKEEAVAQNLFRDYQGERYYLCCAACGPLFDADPEKYLAKA